MGDQKLTRAPSALAVAESDCRCALILRVLNHLLQTACRNAVDRLGEALCAGHEFIEEIELPHPGEKLDRLVLIARSERDPVVIPGLVHQLDGARGRGVVPADDR